MDRLAGLHLFIRIVESGLGGQLGVSTSVAFGRRVMVPLVLRYMRNHPGVSIDLSFDDRYVNLVELGVAMAIRRGRLAGDWWREAP